MSPYKAIFHLDEPSKGRAEQALANISNLLDDLGDRNVEVELLANGGGVRALLKGADLEPGQIEALMQRGVHFVACRNSLNHLNLSPGDLLDSVQVVPAGVSELVRRQAEGWAYIRP